MKIEKYEKTNDEIKKTKLRKIYVDLLTNENVNQLENFPPNMIRTTKYTM